MSMPTLRATIALAVLAVAAVLTPVGFSDADASAECTTCCSAASQLCVVCAKTCITVESAYDNGSGPCPS